MENGYSILMLLFALALLLYAALMGLTRDVGLIPKMGAVKVKNPRRYAWQFSKTLACVALAPAVSALAGLRYGPGVGALVLIPAMVVAIRRGIRFMRDVE